MNNKSKYRPTDEKFYVSDIGKSYNDKRNERNFFGSSYLNHTIQNNGYSQAALRSVDSISESQVENNNAVAEWLIQNTQSDNVAMYVNSLVLMNEFDFQYFMGYVYTNVGASKADRRNEQEAIYDYIVGGKIERKSKILINYEYNAFKSFNEILNNLEMNKAPDQAREFVSRFRMQYEYYKDLGDAVISPNSHSENDVGLGGGKKHQTRRGKKSRKSRANSTRRAKV